jgi:transposase
LFTRNCIAHHNSTLEGQRVRARHYTKGRPRQKPERVIADRGYDSDPLRERLRRREIELIVPYRDNNQHRRYEDGRKLRRYKRRWIVERTDAWLGELRL